MIIESEWIIVVPLLDIGVLGTYQVGEIGQFDLDDGEVAPAEEVLLGVAVDVGESVVVAPLEQEMAHAGDGVFQSGSCRNAVVKLTLYGHHLLGRLLQYSQTVALVAQVVVVVALDLVVEVKAYLRTCLHIELRPLVLAPPAQTCQKWYLDIGNRALVLLCRSCGWVDDRLVLRVKYALLPSGLGDVDFRDQGADALEILLAGIAQGHTGGIAAQRVLGDIGYKTHAAHRISSRDTHCQFVSEIADLRLGVEECHEEQYTE